MERRISAGSVGQPGTGPINQREIKLRRLLSAVRPAHHFKLADPYLPHVRGSRGLGPLVGPRNRKSKMRDYWESSQETGRRAFLRSLISCWIRQRSFNDRTSRRVRASN
jgi:hypothetical protein